MAFAHGYVSLDELLDWVRAHPLGDGRFVPVCIWGSRGIGKCVAPDTPIVLNGERITISAAWDRWAGEPRPDGDGFWASSTKQLRTVSVDGDLRLASGEVVHFYRQQVSEPGRTVVLESGERLTMTRAHRLRTLSGWRNDLRVDDLVAVPAPSVSARPRNAGHIETPPHIEWRRIAAVEEIRLEGWVYDLEVAEHHNYLAAGIVTHNTQALKQYTVERGIGLRVIQPAHLSQGSDLVGIPFIDQETRKTVYALPDRLPKPDDEDVRRGGILFLDEINRANLAVLQGLMEVIGEGTIGQSGWELPEGWMVVAAANPNIPGYDVNTMDDAMVGRMLHYSPGFSSATWTRWATENNVARSVVNFVLQNPDLVDGGESELPQEVRPTLNPRTAYYLACLYEAGMPLRVLDVIANGLWGDEAAQNFLTHHLDTEAPLSGGQILRGGWQPTVDQWVAGDRFDLLRASSELLISMLSGNQAVRSRAAEGTAIWMAYLPQSLFVEMVVSIGEACPEWLPVILTYAETGVGARMPRNRSMLRRPAQREMVQQRQGRTERRRVEESAREELVALPPARSNGGPEIPGPDDAVEAPPAPPAPAGAGSIRPLGRDDSAGADDDLPFTRPDTSQFQLPDFD
ncbi:AAA family ATPase [Miltoncostaea oceani]|uniref:AAA family ATPase n=1 Tax=Miltoncostaea oceani TaxID=2843216 RepID=UPI001C3E0972|nr:AAA family ATPase [Miltoncostaea oceani]